MRAKQNPKQYFCSVAKVVPYPRYVATSSWSQVSGTRDARDQKMEPFIDVSVGGQDLREGELQVGVRVPQY